jgi:hypothetical protein
LRASFLNMRRVLHILTRPNDALAQEVMAGQNSSAECIVETVDLTVPTPDYTKLLEKIFAADSVQSW